MTSIRHTTRNEGAAKSTCDRDLVLKILVIGGPSCGKTSLIRRYVHDAFHSTMRATVGVDFARKQVHRGGGCQVLQLWDVAGQKRNSTTTRVYFQAALGAMVVCDAHAP
ncbi:ras-related GTP-binding protein, putative [Bodo saltans]|uniref:Ras-related GTP-binding protein, putative n=1 Tax=Bodo saltans TaxID=75058 RepID=A0A0S4JNI6_BODSA|nr:ras-related GTP-binding protein, putative [Bodo saltans]|eukprot:CUG93119.1 ras-related GTP-binding protein, putative [Bodo saltans]